MRMAFLHAQITECVRIVHIGEQEMNDNILEGDIEEPWERLIEECKWRKDMYGVYICSGEAAPCNRVIEKGLCDVLRNYFRRGNKI